MSSAYVISNELIIPMPFEDYLQTLMPYIAPNSYHKQQFDLTIGREDEVLSIKAKQTINFYILYSSLYVKGTVFLSGSVSPTPDGQTLIRYAIDSQNIYDGLVRRNAISNPQLMLIFFGAFCYVLTLIYSQSNFLIVFAIFIGLYAYYAITVNGSLKSKISKNKQPYFQDIEKIRTNFENRFIHLITPTEFKS
jgi:hypothetical protein